MILANLPSNNLKGYVQIRDFKFDNYKNLIETLNMNENNQSTTQQTTTQQTTTKKSVNSDKKPLIIASGRMTANAEMKFTTSGVKYANFTIINNQYEKAREAGSEDTTTPIGYRVTVYEREAENVSRYINQGDLVQVVGKLEISRYTDKQGAAQIGLGIAATEVQLLRQKGTSFNFEKIPPPPPPIREALLSRKRKKSSSSRHNNKLI